MLSIVEQLDRETTSAYHLLMSATNPITGGATSVDVYVNVDDENDNAPLFTQTIYNATVPEDTAPGSPLLKVSATDADVGVNARLMYSIEEKLVGTNQPNKTSDLFYISSESGVIYLKAPLDYEVVSYHHFIVVASDCGHPQMSSTAQVFIKVGDVNDNRPLIEPSIANRIDIDEQTQTGDFVTKVVATDPDWCDREQLRYRILSGSNMAFSIDEHSGLIVVQSLSSQHHSRSHRSRHRREHRRSVEHRDYYLNVSVTDGLHSATQMFHVYVAPTNRHSPKFRKQNPIVVLPEDKTAAGRIIYKADGYDQDDSPYSELRYSLINDHIASWFSINSSSGELSLTRTIDYDALKFETFWLMIAAHDRGQRMGMTSVQVTLVNANDNPPRFAVDEYQVVVCSNVTVGTTVLTVLALDVDEEYQHTGVQYHFYDPANNTQNDTSDINNNLLESSTAVDYIDQFFGIKADTGSIYIKSSLAGLPGKTVQFFVRAVNARPLQSPSSSSSSSSSATQHGDSVVPVTIQITGKCRHPAKSSFRYEGLVSESSPPGTVIAELDLGGYSRDVEVALVGIAEDALENRSKHRGQMRKHTANPNSVSMFQVDQGGRVTLQESTLVDYETRRQHTLVLKVTDRITFVTHYYYVLVHVLNTNDGAPFFDLPEYHLLMAEDQPVGSSIFKLTAFEPDKNDVRFFLNTTFNSTFMVDFNTKWIVLNKPLDREQCSHFELVVSVTDSTFWNSTTVYVDVADVNDNPPTFGQVLYEARVAENAPFGTVITRVEAKDVDTVGQLFYYIIEGDYMNQFGISQFGDVYLNKPIDREFLDHYQLTILATDGKYQARTYLKLAVDDVNDNGPVCVKTSYIEMVSEAVRPGTNILTIEATDLDEMPTGGRAQFYYWLEGDHADAFAIDQASGRLRTVAALDREQRSAYEFDVVVADNERRDLNCRTHVEILLSDVNDEPPRFLQQTSVVNVPEDSPVGLLVGKVTAIDNDVGANSKLYYQLLSVVGSNRSEAGPHDLAKFSVDSHTGIIRLIAPLDRETRAVYNLKIAAFDSAAGGNDAAGGTLSPKTQLNSTTNFVVEVGDINDNPPEFEQLEYKPNIAEDAKPGTEVVRLFATSRDVGVNAQITYHLLRGNINDTFHLNATSGVLTLLRPLDYEVVKVHFLTALATDHGEPPLSSEVSVIVQVTDVNDCRPQFIQKSYDIVIREDAAVGERIVQLVAMDDDSRPNAMLSYSFAAAELSYKEFKIDPITGILMVDQPLDRESISSYILEVFVTDNGKPEALTSSVFVNVKISDVNDNAPTFTHPNQSLAVQESRPIGFQLTRLVLNDRDGPNNAGPFKLRIVAGNDEGAFEIVDDVLQTRLRLSSKRCDTYRLTIKATDAGQPALSTLDTVTIVVMPEPKSPPKIEPLVLTFHTVPSFSGGVLGQVPVSGGAFDRLSFSLTGEQDQALFAIDPINGTLAALPVVDVGRYELNVTVSTGQFTTSGMVTIEVIESSETMLDHASVVEVENVPPQLFAGKLLRDFQTLMKNTFKVRAKDVHVLAIRPLGMFQEEEEEEGNEVLTSKRRRRNEPNTGVSILLAVNKNEQKFFTSNEIRAKWAEYRAYIEKELGYQVPNVDAHLAERCATVECGEHGSCRESLEVSPTRLVAIQSSESFSTLVTPFHRRLFQCQCLPGFGGHRCETPVNECSRAPCPAYKECVPVTSHLGYVCRCPFGKVGEDCSQPAESCLTNEREDVAFCFTNSSPISFNGTSYLHYQLGAKRFESITMRVRTYEKQASLFVEAPAVVPGQVSATSFGVLEVSDLGSSMQTSDTNI